MNKRFFCIPVLALWLALTAALWLGPKKDISDTERRKLTQFPKLSTESIMAGRFMSGFETFCQDQFPGRESFRTLKARFDRMCLGKLDSNGIAIVDGQAVKLEYPLHEKAVAADVQKFEAIRRDCLGDAGKLYFCVIPDKAYYLSGIPTMDYDALFETFKALDFAQFVDIRSCLSADSYYSTDLHWDQVKLLSAADTLCDALGIAPAKDLETETAGSFWGVYKGQSALPMEADTLRYLTNDLIGNCTVTAYGADGETAVYDLPKFTGRDPYDLFLSGSAGLLTVRNPAGESGKKLVVFRDSFGSSLVPLLLQGYETVELVDIRYLPASQLGKLMDFAGKDVLFLYSTTVLNTPGIFK